MMMMEPKPIDLCEFLAESELQQYYNSIKNELKITTVVHLKYASDEDLKQIGLSRPEIRRLRKFYDKYYPHGYLSKIKRLLQNPRKDEQTISSQNSMSDVMKNTNSPSKVPSNKHIIPADAICVNKQLGIGEFGIVQQGVWTNGSERIQVAIKCLCRERMQSNPMEFLKEAAIMHSIEHENIVRLYGVVLDTDSLMLVTELAHLRSLLECLKDSGLRVSFLTVPTLCEFAMQICNGMMYLENKRLIHRDLAARNILVFSKNKVKISDFGLSRALGVGKDYYQTNFNVNLKLPIAWCAPECINFLRFTNASDVWAFGVCLWEMFSYGFQPWAALTGHQILEAIDEPNYQRLEQPECCPKEYYALMLKCWQHDPNKRPRFSEIFALLPDMKPEQVKTVAGFSEPKKEHLMYRQGEIITVLDRSTNSPYWKGVLNSGKTGLFNPANTVTYLGSLPSSTNRDSFTRTADRLSKRKLNTEMISRPQNDLKHTGHVGLDGAYFGDVAFIASSQHYNRLPRQIVTPYKPSEDIEQTPLLHPTTPTSPDSTQTASGYFSESLTSSTNHLFPNLNETTTTLLSNVNPNDNFGSYFDFSNQPPTTGFSDSNPFAHPDNNNHQFLSSCRDGPFSSADVVDDAFNNEIKKNIKWPESIEGPHEYHEISDDEIPAEKFDLGPSLLDEMDFMFRSMSANSAQSQGPQSPDFEHTNKKNEIAELTSKLHRKNSSGAGSSVSSSGNSSNSKSKKKAGTVKPLSMKDDKILNQAIEFANEIASEISARSMTDLVSDAAPVAQSPKRKFSFRFPNLHSGSHNSSTEKDSHSIGNGSGSNTNTMVHSKERKNFSEEIKNVPDLQSSITEEHRQAYNSLVEKPTSTLSKLDFMKSSFDPDDLKPMAKTLPRNLATKTTFNLPPSSTTRRPTNDMRFQQGKEMTDFTIPSQLAPKPSTLHYKNGHRDFPHEDSNPLRILRNKNYPIVRPRIKCLPVFNDENTNPISMGLENSDKESMCESPSYLTNTEYTYPERDVNIQTSSMGKELIRKDIDALNPIPLPPRDRNKTMPTNTKRHVRKHALIIPGSGLQRTLNKVTQSTPTDEKSNESIVLSFQKAMDLEKKSNNVSENNYNTNSLVKRNLETTSKLKEIDHCYVNQDDMNTNEMEMDKSGNFNKDFLDHNYPSISDRTYENLEIFKHQIHDSADTASLHFESILENDINEVSELSSPDVIDGFSCFDIHKDHYDKAMTAYADGASGFSKNCDNKDEFRNLDIEKKKMEFCQKYPKYSQPQNELANNALFNKIKETVNPDTEINDNCTRLAPKAMPESSESYSSEEEKVTENNLKESSNSVSCEDLLEFSEKKPKGRERGVESDEVRIMIKVLGKKVPPAECLIALELIEWDVHKAIKIIKLLNLLNLGDPSCKITLDQCASELQIYEWDLQKAAFKLKMK